MGKLHFGGAQTSSDMCKVDTSRRGQSGILRQAVKARKPVPRQVKSDEDVSQALQAV